MLQEQEIELILGNAKCNLIMHGNSAVPVVSPAHVHPYFELFYVWQGTVEIISDERKYRIGQGQAALIAPNCYHQTFYDPDAEKFNVYFSFEPLSKRRCKEDIYTTLTQTFSGSPITVMDSAPEIGFFLFQSAGDPNQGLFLPGGADAGPAYHAAAGNL